MTCWVWFVVACHNLLQTWDLYFWQSCFTQTPCQIAQYVNFYIMLLQVWVKNKLDLCRVVPYLPHFLHGNIASGSCGGFTGALLFFAAGSARGLWAGAGWWTLFTVTGSFIMTIVPAWSTKHKQALAALSAALRVWVIVFVGGGLWNN